MDGPKLSLQTAPPWTLYTRLKPNVKSEPWQRSLRRRLWTGGRSPGISAGRYPDQWGNGKRRIVVENTETPYYADQSIRLAQNREDQSNTRHGRLRVSEGTQVNLWQLPPHHRKPPEPAHHLARGVQMQHNDVLKSRSTCFKGSRCLMAMVATVPMCLPCANSGAME